MNLGSMFTINLKYIFYALCKVETKKGMKTVRISEANHSKLVSQAAYLTLERKKKVSLDETIGYLIQQKEDS